MVTKQRSKSEPISLNKIRALISATVSRAALAARAGLQFGGKRDLYAIFGYKSVIKYEDYIAKYVRQDIASRIIDAPAAATWQGSPTIITENEDFTTVWDTHTRQTNLWTRFERADKLAGLGRYSVLLTGFDDGRSLEKPVSRGAKRKVLYLQPYGDGSVGIESYVKDPQDPRFSLPEIYKIKVIDPSQLPSEGDSSTNIPSSTSQGAEILVHHSRVLHVAENLLENEVFGTPRMQQVYNLLDDLIKVAGGSAESYWMMTNRGMQVDVDKEMEFGPVDAAALSDEIDEYQHELRRVMRTKGVTIKHMGEAVSDPSGTFRVIISLISGATGIPQRILLGAEAGQLASMVDRANWADRIEERRIDFAEPVVLRPYITNAVAAGVLPDPGEYTVKWPSAFKLTPLEDAQMMAQKARAVVNLSRQAQQGFPLVTQEEAREIVGLEGTVNVSVSEPTPPTDVPGGSGAGNPTKGNPSVE